jgi:hypothetical protein
MRPDAAVVLSERNAENRMELPPFGATPACPCLKSKNPIPTTCPCRVAASAVFQAPAVLSLEVVCSRVERRAAGGHLSREFGLR